MPTNSFFEITRSTETNCFQKRILLAQTIARGTEDIKTIIHKIIIEQRTGWKEVVAQTVNLTGSSLNELGITNQKTIDKINPFLKKNSYPKQEWEGILKQEKNKLASSSSDIVVGR